MSRALNWVFTLNNPSTYDIPNRWQPEIGQPIVKYCIWQAEVGDSGTEHLQGYVVFHERMRLSQLRELYKGHKCHWEVRKGDHEQAKQYCCKQDGRVVGPYSYGDENGIPLKKGQRMDLDALKKELDDPNMEMADIVSRHFSTFLRYHRGIEAYKTSKVRHRPHAPPKIFIFWGPSGTGKSRLTMDRWPNQYRKMKSDWWQGYTGQDVVVFDDFYGWISYDEILRILDWYRMDMPIKGASCPLSATTFVFTSNKPWEEWYSKINDTSALKRRIEEFGTVEYMGQPDLT